MRFDIKLQGNELNIKIILRINASSAPNSSSFVVVFTFVKMCEVIFLFSFEIKDGCCCN